MRLSKGYALEKDNTNKVKVMLHVGQRSPSKRVEVGVLKMNKTNRWDKIT